MVEAVQVSEELVMSSEKSGEVAVKLLCGGMSTVL
jgi:hypothetical protein